jgi:hypothetical protein
MAEAPRTARLLQDFRRKLLLDEQLAEKKAQALADQARVELHYARDPRRASELAGRAIRLDPDNHLARRLLTEARALLGDDAARDEWIADALISSVRVQQQSLLQEYLVVRERAAELMEQERYDEAAAALRRAQQYLDALGTYDHPNTRRINSKDDTNHPTG